MFFERADAKYHILLGSFLVSLEAKMELIWPVGNIVVLVSSAHKGGCLSCSNQMNKANGNQCVGFDLVIIGRAGSDASNVSLGYLWQR